MTPQELKNSILQLAIQGKLVEQRPEEGTAEELFVQIQEEKQRMTQEGKLKKTKALPSITDEEIPANFPSTWKVCYIDDIAFVTKLAGFEYTNNIAPNLTTAGIPLFKGKNVQNGKLVLDFDSYIPEQVSDELSRSQITKKCLLTPYVGTIGNIAIFNGDFKAHLGSNVGKIELFNGKKDYITEEFVLYYLRSQIGYQQLTKYKKATAQESISIDAIRNVIIAFPPIAEQKQIVAKIEELLLLVDRYEQAWSKLEQFNSRFLEDMKKSLLQYAIQGKLVEQRPEEGTAEELFAQIQEEKQRLIAQKKIKKEKPLSEITDDEKPFDIPESWKWVRFGDIAIFQGGYAYKSTSYIPKSNNQVIRLGNIKQGDFLPSEKQVFISDDLANETDQYRVKANDILISMTGTRRKKDYFYAVIIEQNMLQDTAYYLNQRVGCFRTFNNIYPQFLYYVLRCETIREIIFTKETGTANQGNLGSEDIKKYVYIPLPPLAEQKRIVEKLEQLLLLCERLK